jgi:CO/xanthine dehydrogenase FAD-binding subunit
MEEADKGNYEKAAEIASQELQFLDSSNISKEYRIDLTKVYVLRGLKEVNE